MNFTYVVTGYDYIYTPCGKSVECEIVNELSPSTIASSDYFFENDYPNAQKLGPTTNTYNSLGYAWHTFRENTPVNINEYDHYGNPNASKYHTGDYYLRGTQSSHTHMECGNYAAVKSDNIKYISKWGPGPLMKHDLYDSPFQMNGSLNYFKHYVSFDYI